MRIKSTLAFGVVALSLAGCGGGGASSSGGGSASPAARVGVFVTDGLGTYDHVWVKLKQVTATGPGGTKTLFSDVAGKVFDLASLHDGSGSIFSFLGLSSIPAGTYTSLTVQMDATVVLFSKGSKTGVSRTFSDAVAGIKTIQVQLTDGKQTVKAGDNIIVDFDLSQWNDDGAHVSGSAKMGSRNGLDDPARHQEGELTGTITTVSTSGFTLQPSSGLPLTIAVGTATEIFGNSTTVAVGQTVEVRGNVDSTTGVVTATSVKVEDRNEVENESETFGSVSAIGTDGFDLAVTGAQGFLPSSTTIHVKLSPTIRFRGRHGVNLDEATFLSSLTTGASVEVEGTFDASTSTLQATSVKSEGEHEGGDDGGTHGGGGEGSDG